MGFLFRRPSGNTVAKLASDSLHLAVADFYRLSGVKRTAQDLLNLMTTDTSRTNGVRKAVSDALSLSLGEATNRIIRQQFLSRTDALNLGLADAAEVAGPGLLSLSAASYSVVEFNTLTFQVLRGNGDIDRVRATWTLTGMAGAAPSVTTGTVTFNDRDSVPKVVSISFQGVAANLTGAVTLSNPENLDGDTPPTLGTNVASVTVTNDLTAPTAPVLGVPTVSGTTITVPLQTPSVDTGSGLQDYILERAEGSASFVLVQTGLEIWPRANSGLTPGGFYRFRAAGRDRAGNTGPYSAIIQATVPDIGLNFPDHSATLSYRSIRPRIGGYGLNTLAGSGRYPGAPAVVPMYWIDRLGDGNIGGARPDWGPEVYAGTWEYCWRNAQTDKQIRSLVSGWITIRDNIPNGTRPGNNRVSCMLQSAPAPGLFIRGCNLELNGGSDIYISHARLYMGDDAVGLSAGARDCLSSGWGGGVTQKIVVDQCDLAWSVDELGDFTHAHSELTIMNSMLVEPLHRSTVVHPEDGPNVDHGFSLIIGSNTNPQTEAVSLFRNVFAGATARQPLITARTYVHANNVHFDMGRPGGGAGNAIQIIFAGATQENYANILWNDFIRGPDNNATFVGISVTGTPPVGSAAYAEGNANTWAVRTQAQYFTQAPANYISGTLQVNAMPGSWGTGTDGVLKWHAIPGQPTTAERLAFITLLEKTCGAQPRYRSTQYGRTAKVFNEMRDAVNGVAQSPLFVDTVAQANGWFSVPENVINPLSAGGHWHAPCPMGVERANVHTTGTFSDGTARAGYTWIDAWDYEQGLFVTEPQGETETSFIPTHFVSASASGSGNGLTRQTAWTMNQAVANCLPGMKIMILAGTYNAPVSSGNGYLGYWNLSRAGTQAQPIIWFCEGYASLTSTNRVQFTMTPTYPNGSPVISLSGQWNQFYGAYIHEGQCNPAVDTSTFIITGSNTKVAYCVFDRGAISTWVPSAGNSGNNLAAIRIENATNVTVSDNRFLNYTSASGVSYGRTCLQIFSSQTVFAHSHTIEHNEFDNCDVFVYFKGAGGIRRMLGNMTIRYNKGRLTTGGPNLNNYFLNLGDCAGIGGPWNGLGPNRVYQNVVSGGEMFVRPQFQSDEGGRVETSDVWVYNNTVMNLLFDGETCFFGGVYGVGNGATRTWRCHNNVYYNTSANGSRMYSSLYNGGYGAGTIKDGSYLSGNHNTVFNLGSSFAFVEGVNSEDLAAYRARTGRELQSRIRNPQLQSIAYGNASFGKLTVGTSLEFNAGVDAFQLLGGATTALINCGAYITADQSDPVGIRAL